MTSTSNFQTESGMQRAAGLWAGRITGRKAVSNYFGFWAGLGVQLIVWCIRKQPSWWNGREEIKTLLSIHNRGWSRQSSCGDYALVSTHFTVSAWRHSPAPRCGKWNINTFDLFHAQDVSGGWHTSCLEMRSAGMSQTTLFPHESFWSITLHAQCHIRYYKVWYGWYFTQCSC